MANPRKIQKLFDEAVAAFNAKDLPRAKVLATRLVKMDKANFSCWHLKAAIHGQLGEVELAEKAFGTAAALAATEQDRATVYEQLSLLLMQNQRPSRATKYLAKLQSMVPARAEFTCYLADAYRLSDQPELALAEYDSAMSRLGEKTELLAGKAASLRALRRTGEAVECLQKLLAARPGDVETIVSLAECLSDTGDIEAARTLLHSAIDADPENAYLHYRLALFCRDAGEIGDAVVHFERAIARGPVAATVFYNYARIKTFTADDPVIGAIQQRLDALPDSDTSERIELLFALGKIAEDCQQYDEAFEFWRRGNAIKRSTYDYKVSDDRKRVDNIKNVVDAKLISRLQLGDHDGPTPIFVVGMPRSGSTLCEQILSSHSNVRGLGELTLLPKLLGEVERQTNRPFPLVLSKLDKKQLEALRDAYLARLSGGIDRPYFTDKLPGNFWLAGLIRMIFPRSPIINANRDPIDAGFSCFKHLFADTQKFAYDLGEIARYTELYRELMAYWHQLLPESVYDLRYEELVNSPEEAITSLLSFCGLPFEPNCLDFHRTKRVVKSASAAQIRQPLHAKAVGFWQHYATHLDDLKALQ